MKDKRSESQWPDIHTIAHGDMPEGFGTMTPEAQDELAEAAERERTKIPYMSRNAEDIENSKRSRGERL
jgi:hypothetical protein